ncbi:MAG TPA: retroviral-like aspartic protease family protein [Steroidobacteraceae bacterium]
MRIRSTRSPLAALSRRHFLGASASSLLLTSMLTKAQTPALPVSADSADPSASQPPDRINAASDAAQRLTVNVRLNGTGPYRFVVDTGADRSVVADDVAANLGPLRGRQVVLRGIVRTMATETVHVRELAVGSARHQRIEMPVVPRSMLEADGYLGLDTIDGYRVTFDFKQHALEIDASHSSGMWYLARPDQARVRTVGSAGRLRSLDCKVAGVSTTAFIDSGAEVSVGNPPLLNALGRHHPLRVELGTLPLTGVTGGQVIGQLTVIDRISLQDLEFTDCTLVIADLPIFDIWGLTQQPALLIGMNYLRQFARVSIDYRTKEIRFDLASLLAAQPA